MAMPEDQREYRRTTKESTTSLMMMMMMTTMTASKDVVLVKRPRLTTELMTTMIKKIITWKNPIKLFMRTSILRKK